jgi:hypothetical protein
VFGESADDPHPLRRRGSRNLPLKHRHGVGDATHAVPTQLQVEIEAAAYQMKVIVDQAWQNESSLQVDDARCGPG